MAFGASNTIFHIREGDDLYEISLQGYIIARITCYMGGRHRQDVQYDDLPQAVKDKVVDKVRKLLKI